MLLANHAKRESILCIYSHAKPYWYLSVEPLWQLTRSGLPSGVDAHSAVLNVLTLPSASVTVQVHFLSSWTRHTLEDTLLTRGQKCTWSEIKPVLMQFVPFLGVGQQLNGRRNNGALVVLGEFEMAKLQNFGFGWFPLIALKVFLPQLPKFLKTTSSMTSCTKSQQDNFKNVVNLPKLHFIHGLDLLALWFSLFEV